jgi:hypothetical protein
VSTTARPARWWERPDRDLYRTLNGNVVTPAGRSDMVLCPKCGQRPVVYNGNYFCDGYAPLEGGTGACDWVLAHPATTKRDREVCDLIGIDRE